MDQGPGQRASNSATAKLIVYRPPSDHWAYFRSYAIELDGALVARLRRRERVALDVRPGRHLLRARCDHLGSPPVHVELEGGATLELRVEAAPGPNIDKVLARVPALLMSSAGAASAGRVQIAAPMPVAVGVSGTRYTRPPRSLWTASVVPLVALAMYFVETPFGLPSALNTAIAFALSACSVAGFLVFRGSVRWWAGRYPLVSAVIALFPGVGPLVAALYARQRHRASTEPA